MSIYNIQIDKMSKTSQESMNKILGAHVGNVALQELVEQAQKQERLECYKKELDKNKKELGGIEAEIKIAEKYNNRIAEQSIIILNMFRLRRIKEISQLQAEIKILEEK